MHNCKREKQDSCPVPVLSGKGITISLADWQLCVIGGSYSLFFKKNNLEDISPFVGPLIPTFCTSSDVSSEFQSQSGQPYSHLVEAYTCYIFTESHLWCDTYQPLGGQHGSHASLFYVPVKRQWWGLKPGSIMPLLSHRKLEF